MLEAVTLFNQPAANYGTIRKVWRIPHRQVSHGRTWDTLNDDVTIQMVWSGHAPAVKVVASPGDSGAVDSAGDEVLRRGWPREQRQAPASSSRLPSTRDPFHSGIYHIESFTIAPVNMAVAVMLRQERFQRPFLHASLKRTNFTGGAGGGGEPMPLTRGKQP